MPVLNNMISPLYPQLLIVPAENRSDTDITLQPGYRRKSNTRFNNVTLTLDLNVVEAVSFLRGRGL
jgi:hypothetical protein